MQKSHILIPRWNHGTPVRCKLPLSVVTFPPLSLKDSKKKKYRKDRHNIIFATSFPMAVSIMFVCNICRWKKTEDWKAAQRLWKLVRMMWGHALTTINHIPLYFVQHRRLPQFTHVNRTCSLTQGYFEKGENVYRGLMRICST